MNVYPWAMAAAYTERIPGLANLAFDCACSRGVGSLANARFNADGKMSALNRHNCLSRYRPVGDGTPGVWLKLTISNQRWGRNPRLARRWRVPFARQSLNESKSEGSR
ncbi:unnamed protein product [Pylaiella littoralis]